MHLLNNKLYILYIIFIISPFLEIYNMRHGNRNLPAKSWGEIEKELLSGQKLHASILIKQINEILKKRGLLKTFPLFKSLYKIAYEGEKGFVLVKNTRD